MKAAYIDAVGPPEAIRYGELPDPVPGPGDVLVRVTAVAVNPVDTYIRAGTFRLPLPRPFVIGRDLAGVVVAVGPAVTRFRPGDRVWCNNQGYDGRQGTFAELAAVAEGLLYPLPDGVDVIEAVAFAHAGLTACLGLARVGLRTGETLFLGGGSGSVGSAVLQLAHARGARVFTTAGTPDGLAWCRSLGAEVAVNYKADDVDAALAGFVPGGVDVYWDTSGHADLASAVARLARRGRVVVMAGLGAEPRLPVGPFYLKDGALHGFAVTYATTAELAAAALEINRQLTAGVRVRIGRVLPLADATLAHRLVEDRAALAGKVVLTP